MKNSLVDLYTFLGQNTGLLPIFYDRVVFARCLKQTHRQSKINEDNSNRKKMVKFNTTYDLNIFILIKDKAKII